MTRVQISNSSTIKSIGYSYETQTLEIEFHRGGVYQYADVPQATYQEFISVDSVGSYFHANIKTQFTATKMGS